MTDAELDIRRYARGLVDVVELEGTLDLTSAARLLSVLTRVAGSGAHVVVCDLSRLRAPAIRRLLMVFPDAQRCSGPWPRSALHLAAPGRELAQDLRHLGMPRFLPVHPSLHRAVRAATVEASAVHRDVLFVPQASTSRATQDQLNVLWPEVPEEHGVHQDGLLVAGELTANACRHVGGQVTVSMALSCTTFLVAVTDGSRRLPTLDAAGTSLIGSMGAHGSRGMQLVSTLSQDWGVRLVHGSGKTVWATFDRRRVGVA